MARDFTLDQIRALTPEKVQGLTPEEFQHALKTAQEQGHTTPGGAPIIPEKALPDGTAIVYFDAPQRGLEKKDNQHTG